MPHPHLVVEPSNADNLRLLDRLHPERRANQAAWERMIAEEPG